MTAPPRLYYNDSYLRRFSANTEGGANVFLDQTAFYPTSGGQPNDLGLIGPARVLDVVEEADGRIAHALDQPLPPGEYSCEIDWARRFDHMQQHSGQHLLSAILADRFQAPTVSVHIGSYLSTIDVEAGSSSWLADAESQANAAVYENRPITVSYHDAAEPLSLRKATGRSGILRLVTIAELDRSACGGTHVAATAEIGPILLRKLDKIRGNLRIEFVCGLRAITRARADFQALTAIARHYSSPLDQTPALVAAQAHRLAESDKLCRKLSLELASIRGRQLHADTIPNSQGIRVHTREIASGPLEEDLRAEAQAFTTIGGGSVFLTTSLNPPSVLLCTSAEAPLKAGPTLKAALEENGGRGGGSPTMAQGSLPTAESIPKLVRAILQKLV